MASSQPMKQSSLDLSLSTKKTRKQELLAQIRSLPEVITSSACALARSRTQAA